MNIGVDIRVLRGVTGIGRYARCILDELQRIDSKNRYYLFECRETDYTPQNPNWSKISGNFKLPGTLWLLFALPALLKKYEIDVLWAPQQMCPLWGVPPRTKIATTVHDFAVQRFPDMNIITDRAIKSVLIPGAVKKSAALLPVSEFTQNELFKFYPYTRPPQKVIKIVGNAAKDWGGEAKSVPRENFLFFPGNLEPRKNHLRLLQALEIVHDAGFKIDLVLAGPVGWKCAKLLERINTHPLKDRIKYLGFITDAELLNRYLSCAAVIFPSRYEGFGIPVLEAFSLNAPVLTSKGTVMEEIAGSSAMYFDPYDPKSIADTIIEFLKHGAPPINREILKKYTWRRSAESLLEVFNGLVPQG